MFEDAVKKFDKENKDRMLAERIWFERDKKGFDIWWDGINKLSLAKTKLNYAKFTPEGITPG